jgi:hypothetical protein
MASDKELGMEFPGKKIMTDWLVIYSNTGFLSSDNRD